MRSQVKESDSFLFVSRLPDSRVSGDEKRAIQLISKTFGPEIWQKSMLVFTFSDFLGPSQSKVALQKRTRLLRKAIANHAGTDVASHVLSVAVANSEEADRLPGSAQTGENITQKIAETADQGKLIALLNAASTVMSNPDSQIRAEAISKLAELGDQGAVPVLCEALENDRDAAIRRSAAAALGIIAGKETNLES